MRTRHGTVVQAQTHDTFYLLAYTARQQLLPQILPLFRTNNGQQDVVVRCQELDRILDSVNDRRGRQWAVYHSSDRGGPGVVHAPGLTGQGLDHHIRNHKVFRYSEWNRNGDSFRHRQPVNVMSARVFGGHPGGIVSCFAPFPNGPT